MKKILLGLAILLIVFFIGKYILLLRAPYVINMYGLTDWSEQESEITATAIQNHDASICAQIVVVGYIDGGEEKVAARCIEKYIKSYPKEDPCVRPGICPLEVIVPRGKPALCFGNVYCVASIAKKFKDQTICEKSFTDVEKQEECKKTMPNTWPF